MSRKQVISRGRFRGRCRGGLVVGLAPLLFAPCCLLLQPPRPTAASEEGFRRPAGASTTAEATDPDGKLRAARRAVEEAERLRAEWKEPRIREAAGRYLHALEGFRDAGSAAEEAGVLKRLGEVSLLLGEHREALAHFGRALDLYSAAGDPAGEAAALNGMGEAHTFVGKNREAISLFRRALGLGRKAGDRAAEGRALGNLGEAFYNLSDMARALDFLNRSLRAFEAADDRRGRAQALRYLGYVYTDTGELAQALDCFERSLPFWRAAGDLRGEAQSINAIGLVNSLLGERERAIEFYARAERLFRDMGDREGLTSALNGQGELYAALSLERALSCHEEALRLSEETGELEGRIISHRYLGHTRRATGEQARAAGREDSARENYEQSLRHFRQSLDLCATLKDRRIEAYSLLDTGSAFDFLGDADQALAHYGRALRLSRLVRDPRGQAQVLNSIGRVRERQGRTSDALAHFRLALPLARAAEDRVGESDTLFRIGRAERDRGDLRAAFAHAEAALRIVESLRAKVPGHAFRSSYFASVQSYFELSIDVLMRSHARDPSAGFDLKALEVSELARARSLLDMLVESRADIRRGASAELLHEERRLRQLLNAKAARQVSLLSGEHTAEQAAAAEREVRDLSNRYEEVDAQIRKQSPRYAALTRPRPLGIGEIQQRVLDDRSVLLEYALGDERSYVWAVTRAGVAGYELPARARIEQSARTFYGLLTARHPAPGEDAESYRERVARSDADCRREAAALSDMILGPIAGHLAGGRRLLVVADGALQYVPFGALPVPGGGDGHVPLIVEHEITSQPSASVLATLRGASARRPSPAKAVAVFADPVFEADDARLARRGEEPAGAEGERDTGLRTAFRGVSATWSGGSIPRLVGSREEAEAIMGVVAGADNLKAVGFDADKAAVTDPGLGEYRIIHFATHGVLDSERPELSGLLLSRFDSSGRPKESFLRLNDIYDLTLPADLVVLSACQTGLGKDVKGEGLVGLVRGFMYAGSPRVVASLWKVDDEATAELMSRFYRGMLQEGKSPAAALREAQVSMWRQRRWRAPYYWAAFVMQGEYGGRIEAGAGRGRSWAWQSGAASLLGALCCLYAWRRRARRRRTHDH